MSYVVDFEELRAVTRETAQEYLDIVAELDECPDSVYEALRIAREAAMDAIEAEEIRNASE